MSKTIKQILCDSSIFSEDPTLWTCEDNIDSNSVSTYFVRLFSKFPSINFCYLNDRYEERAVLNPETSAKYVHDYLLNKNFELVMRYEKNQFSLKQEENSVINYKFENDHVLMSATNYTYINPELEMVIVFQSVDRPRLICAYNVNNDTALQLSDDLIKNVCQKCVKIKPIESSIKYICRTSRGIFSTASININSPENFDIGRLYNADFGAVHKNIHQFLATDKSGLIILHGEQGTGKTTYIRHLITSTDKSFVYLPMDMAGYLSEPDFISFIKTDLKNSIIVIEDCEQLLRDRADSPYSLNTGLSNILNISDGLLGDGLCLKFICTFNNDVRKIDKALLRKGRLVDKYEFGKLSSDKTAALMKELYQREGDFGEMTLAEIFNVDDENHGYQTHKYIKIGF